MNKLRLLFVGVLFSLPITTIIYAQTRPYWFDEAGVYRNWQRREDVSIFDSKIRTSGVPAWGQWFTLGLGEEALREEITYNHNLGKFYVSSIMYKNINIGDTLYFPADSIAARTITGDIVMPFERLATSLCSPTWKRALKNYLKAIIDAGADGVFLDDMNLDIQLSFDRYSLAAFRYYLNDKYTIYELQTKFDIQDIDNFNYLDWIKAHGQLQNWQYLPLEGLKEEFWKFRIKTDRLVFTELSEYIKNYARQNYQREITISCNAFFAASSSFDIYLDLIDYSVGESHLFGKSYQRPRWLPNYMTGYEVYDFMAIANKVRLSVKNLPTIPLVELEGIGVLNYPSQTSNLIKLIFADAYASQGSVLLNPMFDGMQNDQLKFGIIGYDHNIAGKYANFIYTHQSLFSSLTFNPRCGLLYSMSSLNEKNHNETGGLSITSFYGTGQFLIDQSIPFDVIFAPETRFSTLPDITLPKLQRYETIILPNTTYLNDNQVQVILDYVRDGGTIVALGDIGIKGEDGHLASRPELESLQTENGEKTLGLGKFVYFREERSFGTEHGSFYWANPEESDDEFYNFLKPYIDPELIISGADSVSGFIYQNSINDNTVIHIVNYAYDIPTDQFSLKENFTVKVQADTSRLWEAIYVSPDFLGQQILATKTDSGYISMTIPRLEAYGIVILQQNLTAPQILSRTPETNVTIIGSDSLRFSVEAVDPDANLLFYQWYVNGVVDSLATYSTYLFRTTRDSSGIETITVEVSDGVHMISTYWLINIQSYVFPKILFDESHNERNTISYERAQELNPAHPDWIYFGRLKSKMDVDYITERYESGVLTPSVLQNYNVLILTAPDANFSSSEITNISSFVSNGGGFCFLGDAGLNENINTILLRFGIQFENHVIFEPVVQPHDPGNPIVHNFINHASLGAYPQFNMNWGGSFSISSPAIGLGFTDSITWRNIDGNRVQNANEPSGPFTIICAAEYGKGRVFCISDNALHDDYVKWEANPNDGLFLNALRWLSEGVNKVVAVEEPVVEVPQTFELSQNYPNPFNPTTTIEYQLPKSSEVSLKIYNLIGQKVRNLIDEKQIAGEYSIIWDGKDDIGQQVASGIYMYKIHTQDFVKTKKMIIIR